MKKQRSPSYRPRRRRNSGVRSFFVTLLGSAAIAVLGAGVWQLLDPVEYQPPLAPLTASTLAAGNSSLAEGAGGASSPAEEPPVPESSSPGEGAPEDGTSDVTFQPPGYPEVPEGEWLPASYFDDALFVGDSITEGIKLYDVMNNATVLAGTGVNLSSLYTKNAVTLADGTKAPILEASKSYSPGKIYLMMGTNSLLADDESFLASYGQVVDTLVSQHPGAVLYIQSILPVTAEYQQRANAVADNAKIDRLNGGLKELAAEKGVYYLNVAEVFKDENGCLPTSASPKDGIHFGSGWYRKWFDYLRTHGVPDPASQGGSDAASSPAEQP